MTHIRHTQTVTDHPRQTPAAARFESLPFAEQFLLWGLRLWVRGAKTGTHVHDLLTEGFAHAGAPGGCTALDRLMSTLAVGAAATIDVRCPRCKNVSDDEVRILNAVQAWQSGAGETAADVALAPLLTATGRRFARAPAAELAARIADAGLLLRGRVIDDAAPVRRTAGGDTLH